MNKMMKLLALIMALAMVLCLAACGGDDTKTKDPYESTGTSEVTDPPNVTDPSDVTEPDNGNKTYTVTLVDSQGNAVSGAMVQICLDSCVPGMTDANGVATFELPEESGYSAGVTADYDNTKVYFEDGQYDVTITWDAPAAE